MMKVFGCRETICEQKRGENLTEEALFSICRNGLMGKVYLNTVIIGDVVYVNGRAVCRET
jgi:hypothetical protein